MAVEGGPVNREDGQAKKALSNNFSLWGLEVSSGQFVWFYIYKPSSLHDLFRKNLFGGSYPGFNQVTHIMPGVV